MFFSKKKDNYNSIIRRFSSYGNSDVFLHKITDLQNSINVNTDFSIIIIASIDNDYLSPILAKVLADNFAAKNRKTLIIDANTYNPLLETIYNEWQIGLDLKSDTEHFSSKGVRNNELIELLSIKKCDYPSEFLKHYPLKDVVDKNAQDFQHIIIVCPSILPYYDCAVFSEISSSFVLVAKRNKTSRVNLAKSLAFLKKNNISVSKTVLIK